MDWPDTTLVIAAGVGVALLGASVMTRWVLRRRGQTLVADDLRRIGGPLLAFVVALLVTVEAQAEEISWLRSLGRLGLIVTVTWLVVRGLWVLQQIWYRRLRVDVADNRVARSRRTRFDLLRRVTAAVVIAGGVVVALLIITPFRSFGPTVVAYGGLIAAVLGLVLRTPLENLAAGMMIAFSESVRLDDVVVIDGEWGQVEHIGLVSVIVRIWDDRSLVLPTSRLVSSPFENWTHQGSELIGSVTVWVDYETDVERLRAAVDEMLAELPDYDGRFRSVQVVELGERAVKVRVLATANDAVSSWNLRCDLRERLLAYVRSEPRRLPVARWASTELNGPSLS